MSTTNTPTNQMSKELANQVFRYDNGNLYWRIKPRFNYPRAMMENPIGYKQSGTYINIKYLGKDYRIHNIIWNMHNGIIEEPYCIDHINRRPRDNRIENLRLSTMTDQANNRSKRVRYRCNKTGQKYVHIRHGKYVVSVRFNGQGKQHYIGTYATLEEAVKERDNALREVQLDLFGDNYGT